MSQRMRINFNPVEFLRSVAFMAVVAIILRRLGLHGVEALGLAVALYLTTLAHKGEVEQ